jgi:dolichol-phosphate mannosyltransferase
MLRQYHDEDGRLKLLDLSRNWGHQPAVTAGMHHATGDAVVLIDGDLQDPPELIGALVGQWRQGFKVVLAERQSRAERGVRGVGLRLFYPLMRRVSDLPHGPDAGIFGLMDRVVVNDFNRLPERNRFIPGLRTWLGYKQTSVPYARDERAAGQPKQTFTRLLQYAIDGMLSFSHKPLRAVVWSGFFVSAVSFALATFYVVDFFARNKPITGFTTTIVCVLFLGGIQLIAIGILGEYVGRIYDEIKQRPLYVVADRVGFDGLPTPAAPAVSA